MTTADAFRLQISTEHRQAQAQVAVLAKEKLTLQELYDEMKGLLQNLYNVGTVSRTFIDPLTDIRCLIDLR